MTTTAYDSRPDTYEHIHKVQEHLTHCAFDLLNRALRHDQSKLEGEEKEAFDFATPRLAGIDYQSDEYRDVLRQIKPAVQLHYQRNSHHPEHYAAGIDGMNLLDLIEMLCDWKAASERTGTDGNIRKSIDYNTERFNLSPQLANVLFNTARDFGWIV